MILVWIAVGLIAGLIFALLVLGVIRMIRRDPKDPIFGKGEE